MLLNFKIKNFRSFRDETIFTMVPSLKKMHSDIIIKKVSKSMTVKSLPAAVVYGANASGKSNIILAMYLLKKVILCGTVEPNEITPYLHILSFMHDENYYKPNEFEITFFQNHNIYRYGLSFFSVFDKRNIEKEYLYINEEEIFVRTPQNEVQMPIRELIRKGYIQKTEMDEAFYKLLVKKLNETLDKQQLFLLSGMKNLINNEYIMDIQKWFQQFIVVMDANDVSFNQKDLKSIKVERVKNSNSMSRQRYESQTIKEIMSCAEFGTQQIQFVTDVNEEELTMVSLYEIFNKTKNKDGLKMVVSSQLTESKGTLQLIRLIQPFIDALRVGGIIVLDEMDASLHFEIVVSLIRIFNDTTINKAGAQLIFNTHNPIYLDGTLLRHDQIMMVTKNKKNLTSELYSLIDYGLRPEERILKNYLDGKYGALPHLDLEIAFKHILESEGI